MRVAKATEMDIDAAGEVMAVLQAVASGYYPAMPDDEDPPFRFDAEEPDHLRRFYNAMSATLDKSPGWPRRVIGGMCFVVLYPANRIVDPEADCLELHPRFKALEAESPSPAGDLAPGDDAMQLLDQFQRRLGSSREQCDEGGKVLWDRIEAVRRPPGAGAAGASSPPEAGVRADRELHSHMMVVATRATAGKVAKEHLRTVCRAIAQDMNLRAKLAPGMNVDHSLGISPPANGLGANAKDAQAMAPTLGMRTGAVPGLDATRALFERWAEGEGYPVEMEPHACPPTYRDPRTRAAWSAWWKLRTAGAPRTSDVAAIVRAAESRVGYLRGGGAMQRAKACDEVADYIRQLAAACGLPGEEDAHR